MSHFKNKLPVASLIYKIYVQLNTSYVLHTKKGILYNQIKPQKLEHWHWQKLLSSLQVLLKYPQVTMMAFITKGPTPASYVVLTVSLILITGNIS